MLLLPCYRRAFQQRRLQSMAPHDGGYLWFYGEFQHSVIINSILLLFIINIGEGIFTIAINLLIWGQQNS